MSMRKQAVSGAAGSPMQWLEQIAHLMRSTRSAALILERVLQLLGEALGSMTGAVVLAGEASRRTPGYSWGMYQQQIVQVGRELVEGLEAQSAATARHTVLPGTAGTTALDGVLLAVPLHGLQQAMGVLVLFCPAQPAPTLETALAFLELTGMFVGLYLQTTGLQERLKTLPEPGEAASLGPSLSYDPDRIIGNSSGMK